MNLNLLKKIETQEQYDTVVKRVNELINEATANDVLESETDNEYTREIGCLGILAAKYENEYIKFKYLRVNITTYKKY
ncbi:MAG: hypothetical protein LBT27_00640 [Prevotellaceae bacterium]|nr:hypothetical protein [Prevotellaceae bacterium]